MTPEISSDDQQKILKLYRQIAAEFDKAEHMLSIAAPAAIMVAASFSSQLFMDEKQIVNEFARLLRAEKIRLGGGDTRH